MRFPRDYRELWFKNTIIPLPYLRVQLPAKLFGGVIFVRDGYRAEDYPVPAFPPSDSDDY